MISEHGSQKCYDQWSYDKKTDPRNCSFVGCFMYVKHVHIKFDVYFPSSETTCLERPFLLLLKTGLNVVTCIFIIHLYSICNSNLYIVWKAFVNFNLKLTHSKA